MPNDQQPQDYQSLLELLKQKAAASAKQAWGGRPTDQQAKEQQPGSPAYMQPGQQPNYQGNANGVMESGGFAHGSPAPQATPTPEAVAPPPYMPQPRIQPVRLNQNNADMFMHGAKFRK